MASNDNNNTPTTPLELELVTDMLLNLEANQKRYDYFYNSIGEPSYNVYILALLILKCINFLKLIHQK